MKVEVELRSHKPRNAGAPRATRDEERFSPKVFGGNVTLQLLDFRRLASRTLRE